MKSIVHIDLNAFFAQVEELCDPTLVGKPVAIGSSIGRSVVSTANYEARKYGIGSSMPIQTARKLCPNLILINDHYKEYAIYSERFMSYLRKKYSLFEQASIDECYIDMSEFFEPINARDYLVDLQIELFKVTNLKCSIGVGNNKFLAKLASDYKKPLGVTVLYKENIEQILWPISIEKMFGIGKKTYPRLVALGINTIGDLAKTEDERVKSLLGNTYLYHKSHALGEGDDIVQPYENDPKSISSARTFDHDTTDYEELKNLIIRRSKSISEQLKNYKKLSDTVVITFRNANFITNSKREKFDTYTNDEALICSRALRVFDKYYNGEPLRLLGVGVTDIKGESEIVSPVKLFDSKNFNEKNVDNIINDLNEKLKNKSLVKASDLVKPQKRTHNFHKPEKANENI